MAFDFDFLDESMQRDVTCNQMDRSASKEQCAKIWTTFGINVSLMPMLSERERIKLQLLNKFSYNSMVSRAWTKITLSQSMYFICNTR